MYLVKLHVKGVVIVTTSVLKIAVGGPRHYTAGRHSTQVESDWVGHQASKPSCEPSSKFRYFQTLAIHLFQCV